MNVLVVYCIRFYIVFFLTSSWTIACHYLRHFTKPPGNIHSFHFILLYKLMLLLKMSNDNSYNICISQIIFMKESDKLVFFLLTTNLILHMITVHTIHEWQRKAVYLQVVFCTLDVFCNLLLNYNEKAVFQKHV